MQDMSPKRKLYKSIIDSLIQEFELLYIAEGNKSKLSIPGIINTGDCHVMALLVERIAIGYGLTPTINVGPFHVYITDDGYIHDAYFPAGITASEVEELKVNKVADEEPTFYSGNPFNSYLSLTGYFNNVPARSIFIDYVLKKHGLVLPVGLRKYLKVSSKYRKQKRNQNVMYKTIKHLRNQHAKAGVHIG